MAKYRLGDKARMFYDPTNQKKVLPGQEVEFTNDDLNSSRTKAAINGYHLVKVGPSKKEETPPPSVDLKEKFTKAFDKGEIDEVMKVFKLDELKELAIELEFEIQDDDTKSTLAEAIANELYDPEE